MPHAIKSTVVKQEQKCYNKYSPFWSEKNRRHILFTEIHRADTVRAPYEKTLFLIMPQFSSLEEFLSTGFMYVMPLPKCYSFLITTQDHIWSGLWESIILVACIGFTTDFLFMEGWNRKAILNLKKKSVSLKIHAHNFFVNIGFLKTH